MTIRFVLMQDKQDFHSIDTAQIAAPPVAYLFKATIISSDLNVIKGKGLIMKSNLKRFGLLLTACALGVVANSAVSQERSGWHHGRISEAIGSYCMGYEMGHGMMGGYFRMGPVFMGWGNFAGLNLSAEQKEKISKIRQEARTKHVAIMEKIIVVQEQLQELYEAEKLDSDAINKQHRQAEELRRQMRTDAIEARNQINGVLTKEQLEKSKRWGRGYHSMMWGM